MYSLGEELQNQRKQLKQELKQLELMLEHAPQENLRITQSQGRTLFFESYVNENGAWQRRYLGKKQQKRLKELALKRYCTERIAEIRRELAAIESYSNQCPQKHRSMPDTMMYELPVISEYLQERLKPPFYRAWQWAQSGKPSSYREEEKIHSSKNGLKVRSKSEAMIASSLEDAGIPFRYEDSLSLRGVRFIPDFTIMHPKTGKLIYWEHLGMMDDEGYVERAADKMQKYQDAGIYVGVNLILTVERQQEPLTYRTIRGIVHQMME